MAPEHPEQVMPTPVPYQKWTRRNDGFGGPPKLFSRVHLFSRQDCKITTTRKREQQESKCVLFCLVVSGLRT